jgi:hypothetical protein
MKPTPPLTFKAWLGQQTDRTDDVGLFARIAWRWPQRSLSGYLLELLAQDAGHAAQDGLVQAHDEWKRYSGERWVRIRYGRR